jgi:hypothetical protein
LHFLREYFRGRTVKDVQLKRDALLRRRVHDLQGRS